MFDLSKKERGAVAVFLVIILVPMITCASLFVEASRVKLAQPVISSAGDLTLNTVLSRYDYDLNDYYGMLASAQDVDEVLAVAENYFMASAKSQGVDTTYLKKYVNSIMGMFSGEEGVADFLGIELVEGTFDLSPTTNGALNNAALVKTQIVDFMKFRSPINLAASLLDSFSKLGNEVDSLPEQNKCAEEQQEFYEEEEKVLTEAYAAYNILKKYNELGLTKEYVDGLVNDAKGYEDKYYRIHKKLVYDLAGTSGMPAFSRQLIDSNKKSTKYSGNGKASFDKVKKLLEEVVGDMSAYLTAKNDLTNLNNRITYDSQTTYSTRYYVNFMGNDSGYYSSYVTKANELCDSMARLKNAYENMAEAAEGENRKVSLRHYKDSITHGEKHIDDHYSAISSQFSSIKTNDFNNGSSVYNSLSNRLSGIYNNISGAASAVPSTKDSATDGGVNRGPANSLVVDIYNNVSGYSSKIEEGIKYIDEAVKKLNTVKSLIPTYLSKYGDMKTAANNSKLNENEYVDTVKKDISDRDKSDMMKKLTVENAQAMITRLNNIKSLLGELKDIIDSLKYNGNAIKDIKNLDDFEAKSGVVASNISMLKKDIASYVNTTFSFESKVSTINVTDNNNPEYTRVNTPELYRWMVSYFVNSIGTDMTEEEAKKQYEGFKKSAEDDMKETDTSTNLGSKSPNINKQKNLPSKNTPTKGKKAAKSKNLSQLTSFITDFFGGFSGLFSNGGTRLRDNLYTVDYIMSMFSYDTFENEGMLDLWVKDHPKTEINLTTDFKTGYKDTWKSTDLTFKNNKSLTNKMINSANSFAYGSEVEYILYGGTNSANKTAARSTIYMLRFALNFAPVYAKFFNHSVVVAVATAISAASYGVLPVPLIKAAICLALLCLETATDMKYIRKGIGVKLIKGKDNLFVDFLSGGKKSVSGSTANKTGTDFPYLQYSNYLTLFLFVSMMNTNIADGIYLRIADVIQVNMGKLTAKSDYQMSKANVYYSISADVRIKPLLLPVPMIDNSIDKSTDGYKSFESSKWNTFSYSATRGY